RPQTRRMQRRSFATRPGDELVSKPVPRTDAHLIQIFSSANRYFESWPAQCRRLERSSSRKWRQSAHPNDNVLSGATAAPTSHRGFAFFWDLDMADASSL